MTATTTIAQTAQGAVEGITDDGVHRFLGIPYAAPTSGAGRFLPPQPAQPWTGVREAVAPGPVAPQFGPPRLGDPGEDCLVLNVWTPALTGARPVLVWIHGGGFFVGSGYTPTTDGAALARSEDVVVVSVNHRLALLGFLHLAELGGAEWGFEANPSLLDLVAALEWVRDNIAGFGGDPGRVTIFGHSGGGAKVTALLTSPAARGLFHRAAVHGGPPFGLKDAGRATLVAERALHLLGLDRADPAALRDLPLERLLDVQARMGVGREPTEHGMLFAPVVGTPSLPAYPEEALAAGVAADVPLLTGTALDEARFMLAQHRRWLDPELDVDDETAVRIAAAGVDDAPAAERIVAGYRARGGGRRTLDLLMDLLSDQFAVRTARLAAAHLAGGGRVHSYLCDLDHARPLGAFHGIEMPAFFRTTGRGEMPVSGPAHERAAHVMGGALAAFARTGDPNNNLAAEVRWPEYTSTARTQLRFGDDGFEATSRFVDERVRWWHGVATSPRTDPWGRAFATLAAAPG
ncbi:MAG TPA: carboxylesterase family protein [Pseudonocardia sp.]|uniref:carboxylesterase/lipase family protein n=1 Tax=Pseudonocardia sp. TaxID=60912 RepID=UPI002B4B38F2|nr:carboxylesterase family protein [Pseudonocardia sp.]HLU54801.1 carboxylesterase family protein [Pseudonocardia sp.]